MLKEFNKLSSNAHVVFLLALTEKVIDKIVRSPCYDKARDSLNLCWDWVEKREVTGDYLYEYLDNAEETGLFIQMQLEEDEEKMHVWDCVIDAIAFTNWKAYQYDGEEYLPASIESVDEELVEHFIEGFEAINSSHDKVIQKLLNHLSNYGLKDGNHTITKNEIIEVID